MILGGQMSFDHRPLQYHEAAEAPSDAIAAIGGGTWISRAPRTNRDSAILTGEYLRGALRDP
jgi:hypothetical protein